MAGKRIHFVDWLRVFAVLLLIPFHSGRLFNLGEPFYAKSAVESLPISFFIAVVDAWHMPLLFLLAGASTYYAMRRRSIGQYVGERSLRLLVPLVAGTLLVVPPQTWYGARTNDGYTGSFLQYVVSGRAFSTANLFDRGDYFGGISPAHLWFIMFLFLISVASIPLLRLDRTEKGAAWLDKQAARLSRPAWWFLVVFIVMIGEALPDISGKNIFYYGAFFSLGYVLFRSEEFAIAASRLWLPCLAVGAVVTSASVVFYQVQDAMPDPSVQRTLWTYAELGAAWLVLVGLVGVGRRWLDRPSSLLDYLATASYPLYILHQTVIVAVGFYLVRITPAPALGWPLLVVAATVATLFLYEVVRRVPPLRFAFGMKPQKARAAAATDAETTPATP